jgi:hypothetical protein
MVDQPAWFTTGLDDRIARRAHAESRRRVLSLWWCSFASETGFLGVAVVEAVGDRAARRKCRALGIDPGGEMLACPTTEDTPRPPAEYINRLLSEAELLSPEVQALFEPLQVADRAGIQAEIGADIETIVPDVAP